MNNIEKTETLDPALYGGNREPGLVAVDHVESKDGPDRMALFVRRGTETVRVDEPFRPFILVNTRGVADRGGELWSCPGKPEQASLHGPGALNVELVFASWRDCLKARTWLSGLPRGSRNPSESAFLFLNDPVRQHLTSTGRTLFKGMEFERLHRMQVDIECIVEAGFEFCNPQREADRIVAIGLADETGWVEALGGDGGGEKELLEKFVELVRERDPDVIEGHNIFNFDLPYIATRAKLHKVKLALGRDRSVPRRRPSRMAMGERTLSYERFDIFGRHVVDTFFLAQAYDLAERALDGFGLKEVAAHFGLAAEDRTYVAGSDISGVFARDPARILRYVRDDVRETRAIGSLLSRSSFLQAQMLPYSYQNACVRGNATKIDALMLREYLRQGHAVPLPDRPREFSGGYADVFFEGVAQNVHHCDVRSLYPSLMLTRNLGPGADELRVFLGMLKALKSRRLEAREAMLKSKTPLESSHFEALQGALKILINSFYGYLGFPQGLFSDFSAAESVTAEGRALLRDMIAALRKMGAEPIEIDTDGVYFVPPPFKTKADLAGFRAGFLKTLPVGIDVEFDGEYKAMFSYKMKNYALLCGNGDVVIKGAALKSRGLERFQREFMSELIRLKLERREDEIPALKNRYETAIRERTLPIGKLAKTATLQDSPSTYQAKVAQKARARDAAYELALRSGRDFRAGDQLTFYVTGDRKSVAAHENARLVSEWNPESRDENAPYYLAKLDALYAKFYEPAEPANEPTPKRKTAKKQ